MAGLVRLVPTLQRRNEHIKGHLCFELVTPHF